jgi:hypothetical protein
MTFSLDFVNNSNFTYFKRPSSLKESFFRKSSGKLKRLSATLNGDLDKSNISVPRMNKTKKLSTNAKSFSVNSKSFNNEDEVMQSDEDFLNDNDHVIYSSGGECNDLPSYAKTSETKPNINVNEQPENFETDNAKLDTIKESINELIQANIRKLELNDKNKINEAQQKPVQNSAANKNEASPVKLNGILKNKLTPKDNIRGSNSAKPPISSCSANKNASPKKEPAKKPNDFAKGVKAMNQLTNALNNINSSHVSSANKKLNGGVNKSVVNVNSAQTAQKNQQYKNSRSNSVEKGNIGYLEIFYISLDISLVPSQGIYLHNYFQNFLLN